MKKYLKIVSSVLVAVATIGFAWITDYDSNIKAAEKTLQDLQASSDHHFREGLRALNEYENAFQLRNHLQVLETLKAPRTMIQDANNGTETKIKFAILGVDSTADSVKLEKELSDLHSYNDLIPVFTRQQNNAVTKLNRMLADSRSKKQRISEMDETKSFWYRIFLALNSFGLVIGLFSQTTE